jgi:hypothetical protein
MLLATPILSLLYITSLNAALVLVNVDVIAEKHSGITIDGQNDDRIGISGTIVTS